MYRAQSPRSHKGPLWRQALVASPASNPSSWLLMLINCSSLGRLQSVSYSCGFQHLLTQLFYTHPPPSFYSVSFYSYFSLCLTVRETISVGASGAAWLPQDKVALCAHEGDRVAPCPGPTQPRQRTERAWVAAALVVMAVVALALQALQVKFITSPPPSHCAGMQQGRPEPRCVPQSPMQIWGS